MIVRWGLDQLEPLLAELGIERPLLVASPRWDELGCPRPRAGREIPSDEIAVPDGVDGIVAVGGGSAIDTAKAASAASGTAARLRADDVLGLRVDAVLRRPRSRPSPGRRRLAAPTSPGSSTTRS